MPSFDIVSQFNVHEVTNALDQAAKEIAQRYDFKGTKTAVELVDEESIVITSNDEEHANTALDVVYGRMTKRGVSLKHLEPQPIVAAGGQTKKLTVTLKQGISVEHGKKIQALIKDSKMKVQASIQGDVVRVTGKQRDDLQAAMAALRTADVGVDMQFTNFRE